MPRDADLVDRSNSRRLLEPLGNTPPTEGGERYHAMLGESTIAA
jgi:hypothetical protein